MRTLTGLCIVMSLALRVPITSAQVPTWNDVAFATVPGAAGDVTLMIDIYAATTGVGPRPILIWIHGGGWQSGSHNQVPSFALDLRAQGIAVASIGYRLTGDAIFPAQIHDCKGAIRFLRANATTFNIDVSRIGVWGSSAGGHLASLVATSAGVSELEGTTGGNLNFAAPVIACVTFFGPTDILNMHPDCQAQTPTCTTNHDSPTSAESRLLGVTAANQGLAWLRANANNPSPPFPEKIHLAELSNPITHLDIADPPIFIAHGDQDTTVPFAQSIRLRDASAALGIEHVFTLVPGAGHGFLLAPTNAAGTAWMAEKLTSTCPCPTDLNCSGTVTADDIFAFLDAWFAQNGQIGPGLSADFNGNSEVSANDIFAFLDAWFAQNGVCGQ